MFDVSKICFWTQYTVQCRDVVVTQAEVHIFCFQEFIQNCINIKRLPIENNLEHWAISGVHNAYYNNSGKSSLSPLEEAALKLIQI